MPTDQPAPSVPSIATLAHAEGVTQGAAKALDCVLDEIDATVANVLFDADDSALPMAVVRFADLLRQRITNLPDRWAAERNRA